ncbi:hypothetical protein ACF0H5_016288 [Mactra antiquata]
MWQQRSSYEQSNVLDVTIQCQLNVATKNVSEFSTMYGTPMSHYPTDGDSYYNTCSRRTPYTTSISIDNGTPSKPKYQCEFEADNRRQGLPEMTSSTGESFYPRYSHSLVACDSTGYYNACMNDSGYSSPLSNFAQDRNVQYSPCVELSRQSQTGSPVFENVKHAQNESSAYNSNLPVNSTGEQCEEMKLALREKDIMSRLYSLRVVDMDAATSIEQYYHSQTTVIDLERHNVLCQMAYDKKSSDSIHSYYNRKLLSLLECVEGKLFSAENKKCKGIKRSLNCDRKSRLLPKHAVQIMQHWYEENLENPYPSREVTQSMASEGGVSVEQIRKWFANKRNRSRNNKLKASDMDGDGV